MEPSAARTSLTLMRRLLLLLPGLAVVFTACGTTSTSTEPACCASPGAASLSGHLVGIGGPPRAGPEHWSGTISISGRGHTTVHTDVQGHFTISLPPGVYRITGGRLGLWRPKPAGWGTSRLTTTGRRTGQPRSVMIGYFTDGPNLVTMAMNGWGEAEPAWWLNLQANPDATLVTPEARTAANSASMNGSRPAARPAAADVEPIDLIESAGPAVAKRLAPVVVGIVLAILLVRWLRRR